MPVRQAFNKRSKAWVKFEIKSAENGRKVFVPLDVKQSNPKVPFKNVKKV